MNSQKMQIEAGKYYRTRDGRKAFVAGIIPSGESEYPCVGWVEGETNGESWKIDGCFFAGSDRDRDLVAEYREPVTREMLLFECGGDYRAADAKFAAGLGGWKLVGRGTITEGEGM